MSQLSFGASLLFFATAVHAAQFVVSQDGKDEFSGKDERPILAAVAKAKAEGGEIIIRPGTYIISRAIQLNDLKNITFRGEPGAVLKLAPLQHAETSLDRPAGDKSLPVSLHQSLVPGMRLQIHTAGGTDSFSGKTKPNFQVKLASIEKDRLLLAEPLPFPVPAKTRIMNEDAPNLFDLHGACDNIVIEGLAIDGGRTDKDPKIAAHAQRCGVFASGRYNYTEGPIGRPVNRLVVRNCTIRNCFGRGVALYSVTDALVENCTIEDTLEEAVDLDHFVVAANIRNNHIARCRVGIELNDANDCRVENNHIQGCETGLNIWRWCKMEDLNQRNHILNNTVLDTAANGMQLQTGTRLNIIRDNTIRGAGRNGISLGASETIVSGNTIERTAMNGVFLNGDQNELANNRISDAGAGAKQKFAGVRILGAKNRVLYNVILTGAAKDPVANEGKDNIIRMP